MKTYSIIRFYRKHNSPKVIKTGLSLSEAQAHCKREDTHELDDEGIAIWFDGYEEEK